MYRSSAALTAHLADTYGMPKDRTHIVGHNEVPGATHTDPGQYWDWDHYIRWSTMRWTPRTAHRTTSGRAP